MRINARRNEPWDEALVPPSLIRSRKSSDTGSLIPEQSPWCYFFTVLYRNIILIGSLYVLEIYPSMAGRYPRRYCILDSSYP
ncbi:Aminopeptidase N [Klebsiella quasipneumoniae subsp. similipneumoniae]|nr:Aminopeptidase N [Klebsiella quasipneumoniae subsp. similipneumoniae]